MTFGAPPRRDPSRRVELQRALRAAAWAAVVVVSTGLVVLLSSLDPVLAALPVLAVLGVGVLAYARDAARRTYLHLLAIGLLGYAVAGRGFAYLGVAPLFVGEVLLVLGLAVLLARGDVLATLRQPLAWLLILFMLVGLAATAPHVGEYGMDALRDAAQWGYGAFALIVAGLVRDERTLQRVVRWYGRAVPWLLIGPVVALGAVMALGDRMPLWPLSEMPMIAFKGGDVAVHLAGVLGFVVLGLHRSFGAPPGAASTGREWVWWLLWLMALVTTLTVRASFVTLAFSAGLLFLYRPTARWWRLLVVGGVLLAVAVALDVEVTVGRAERPVSVAGLVTMARSIIEPVETSAFDGTRQWRLRWWNDIIDYTVRGDHFWTGKGFGINLADADGYQVFADGSLRSPHNGHLTLLARSGVPGIATWALLLGATAASLLVAYRRRMAEGRRDWANLNLWLLAYLIAYVTNAAFDVYLEGPMGGIWFWSTLGLSLAALRIQRQPRPIARAP